MPMAARQIGIAGGEPVHEPVLLQEIERPVDGNGCWPFAGSSRHQIDHFIGPDRPASLAQLVEDELSAGGQADPLRRMGAVAMVMMIMHERNIGFSDGSDQVPLAKIAAAH